MALPTSDTDVTYPDGATTATGTVLHIEPLPDGRSAVLVDRTAFHPVDAAWPDQPADRGTLTTRQGSQPIVDALTGGIHDGELHIGADLTVRTGTEGWVFVVAHLIEGDPPSLGESVQVDVDTQYRAALSAAHTACHLAALALDAALAEGWSKPAPTDSLGNPAFDALAIQQSLITPHRSADIYRIGKSLRRKGFTPGAVGDPGSVADRVNARLAQWIATGGSVRIERDDERPPATSTAGWNSPWTRSSARAETRTRGRAQLPAPALGRDSVRHSGRDDQGVTMYRSTSVKCPVPVESDRRVIFSV